MMPEQLLKDKQAFVFELDNVIYPEKDYLLQVYYLFAQFIEYGEQLNASDIVKYMQEQYLAEGPENLFEKTAAEFKIPEKYKLNFDLVMQNAKLPLKLLIYNKALTFMQEIVAAGKQVFLFVDGDAIMQLNKIRQVEWNGLEKNLIVYFSEESEPKPSTKGIEMILERHKLTPTQVVMIGAKAADQECAVNAKIEYLPIEAILGEK
ncbi:HAD hydrolase-like protein [Pedobacter gandavensis]|uniref:HAD hydrolase-like protein n=1 Tax=Pedobacter gandavensis TaxID=2679963 RepID=A0ABR6EVW0_9SPHI|nr:HAD hydrolase-like protein [Pedobacter gandavensis]MBB2149101.1 HAD hydrolase-like protein [Pedobacter gandavensis]